ncbi:MAG: methyltransferase domain-containing protein [Chloroflexota bacterium]
MPDLKSVFSYLGLPPGLWITNSPTRIYEYLLLQDEIRFKDQMVLDFGCGDGIFALELARQARMVFAIDMNHAVIARARTYTRLFPFKDRLHFHVGRIEEIKFPSASLDIVFCACVLHLVDNLAEVLLELRRVLKPGGTLHATVDSFEYIQDFSQKAAYQRKHHIVEYFSETTISNRLHEAGFIVETIRPILGGKTAKAHFAKYFEDSNLVYSVPARLSMAKQIALEDRQSGNKFLGAEILVRARKPA